MLCLKRLYFQIYRPDLAEEADEGQEARLEQGHQVGLLAQARFPGGVLIDVEAANLNDAVAQTSTILENPAVPAIFEATFRHQEILVRVDVLQRRPRNRWRLIEVKSSVDLKDYYLYDVAIQHRVVSGCDLDISSACVMHLNRDYVYDGLKHEPNELFLIKDLTRQVSRLEDNIPRLVMIQRSALAQDAPPDIEPGPQCSDPYQCEFFSYCNPDPPENHISYLPGLREKKRQDLGDLGVTFIHEIPDEFPLTQMQDRARTANKTGHPWVSDTLPAELSKLKYPLYFMDFESLSPAIPRYAGMWPYAQIPFQWSLHRQVAPEAELDHFEFLADTDRDPREDFIVSLCSALGGHGQIVVYNASFESRRLRDLVDWLPKYRIKIENIRSRLWDLLPFVRTHIYHRRFQGSFSLKAVLPALVPDLTYAGMEVAHGEQAGFAWDRMIRNDTDPEERARLRSALLAYCRQDTLAMVKILEVLRNLVPFKMDAAGRNYNLIRR